MGNRINTIIVPVDFSESSKKAFYQGAKIARKFNANMIVVRVFVPAVVPAEGLLYMDPDLQASVQERFIDFVEELKTGMTSTDLAEVRVETQFKVGQEGPQIQNVVRETPGSMVIMSTSGEGNLAKEILGSVSTWVVKNIECPILLIPPTVDDLSFDKILYACDHWREYDDAVNAIKYYAGDSSVQIDIIHVFQDGSDYIDKGVEVLHERADEQIKEVIVFNSKFLDSVRDYVKDNAIDLVVMERKDRGFWKELFHVSKTRKMAVYSEVPLLVLHQNEIESFSQNLNSEK